MNLSKSGHLSNSRLSNSRQSGLAAIEFTIVLPFMLLLIFATAEFGRLLYQYSTLNKSVRDGARYLTVYARPNDTNMLEINDEHRLKTKNLIVYGHVVTSTPLLPNFSSEHIVISANDPFITITVNYPWQPIFTTSLSTFGYGNDIDLSYPLVATYTMRALP